MHAAHCIRCVPALDCHSCVVALVQASSDASSASVLPVRVDDSGVAIQRTFQEGVKCEVLRSLCQLVNQSQLSLEVSITDTDADWQVLPRSGAPSSQVRGAVSARNEMTWLVC